jgi:hypothetical protein
LLNVNGPVTGATNISKVNEVNMPVVAGVTVGVLWVPAPWNSKYAAYPPVVFSPGAGTFTFDSWKPMMFSEPVSVKFAPLPLGVSTTVALSEYCWVSAVTDGDETPGILEGLYVNTAPADACEAPARRATAPKAVAAISRVFVHNM